MKAQFLFQRDDQYIVEDGEIVIVDEFTGRMMPGRRYSEGLHQAIEAKEGVHVQRENVTLARITFQNYFRLYEKLAGMTGHGVDRGARSSEDLQPRRRADPDPPADGPPGPCGPGLQDARTPSSARSSTRSPSCSEIGRPVLVGTVSIEKSERLGRAAERRASSTRC